VAFKLLLQNSVGRFEREVIKVVYIVGLFTASLCARSNLYDVKCFQ